MAPLVDPLNRLNGAYLTNNHAYIGQNITLAQSGKSKMKYFGMRPTISVRQHPASVELQFVGVLQASTNAGSGFADVPGQPAGPYQVAPGTRSLARFYRTRSP